MFGVQSSAGEKFYILLQCGSAAHSVSYTSTIGTGCSFRYGKRLGRKACRTPPSSADVKTAWSDTSTPPYVFMAQLNTGAPLTHYRGSQSVLTASQNKPHTHTHTDSDTKQYDVPVNISCKRLEIYLKEGLPFIWSRYILIYSYLKYFHWCRLPGYCW